MAELLGYEELSELTGRSVGALRVARSKGRLPEQDAPGPKWHRESLAAFLKEGTKVPAGGPSGLLSRVRTLLHPRIPRWLPRAFRALLWPRTGVPARIRARSGGRTCGESPVRPAVC